MLEKNKKVVLVVEDEPYLAKAIEDKLVSNSYAVLKARSVPLAIEHLKKNTVDAIWLDHYLLGKDSGLDFVTMMKNNNSKWKDLPIFVVSNTAGTEKIQSYLELDVNKFYVKAETSLTDIMTEINRVLNYNQEV